MRGSSFGLPDSLDSLPAPYRTYINCLDYAFSSLIVAPAVVTCWRSIWELTGIYMFPEQPVLSACVSLSVGFVGHVLFCLYQDTFITHFHPSQHRILYYIMSRTYTILFGIACVNSWRGSFLLLDMYTRFEKNTVITTTVFSMGILLLTRTFRNVSAPPCVVVYDAVPDYFSVPTMFKTSKNDNYVFHLLDCIFSVFVIGLIVIVVWRGSWVLLDLYFYANDFVTSSWNSLFIGYALLYITYGLQSLMYWLSSRLKSIARLIVCDIYLLLSFAATVNIWRGIWNLINIYFLPDDFNTSCWLTFWSSLILLLLLNCSNSLLVRGIYIDGEEDGGKCIIFPIYYFRTIIEYDRARKKLQDLDLETLLKKFRPLKSATTSIDFNELEALSSGAPATTPTPINTSSVTSLTQSASLGLLTVTTSGSNLNSAAAATTTPAVTIVRIETNTN